MFAEEGDDISSLWELKDDFITLFTHQERDTVGRSSSEVSVSSTDITHTLHSQYPYYKYIRLLLYVPRPIQLAEG